MRHLERGRSNIHAVKKSNYVKQEEIGEQPLADTPAGALPHGVRGCERGEVGGLCVRSLRRDGHTPIATLIPSLIPLVESRASPPGSSGVDGRDARLSTVKVPRPLENDFDGELNFARRGSCSAYQTLDASQTPRPIEDVGVIGRDWRCKVRVIEYVEYFGAELNIEPLGNTLDVVILEHGKIERGNARAGHHIAPGVAAQIEAFQASSRKRPAIARRRWVAVLVEESLIWRRRNSKAITLYVATWTSCSEILAARST